MEKGVRGGRACVCPCWPWSPSGAVRGLCAGHRGAESGPLGVGPGGTWLRVQVGTFGKVTLASKLWASPSGTGCWLGPGSSSIGCRPLSLCFSVSAPAEWVTMATALMGHGEGTVSWSPHLPGSEHGLPKCQRRPGPAPQTAVHRACVLGPVSPKRATPLPV